MVIYELCGIDGGWIYPIEDGRDVPGVRNRTLPSGRSKGQVRCGLYHGGGYPDFDDTCDVSFDRSLLRKSGSGGNPERRDFYGYSVWGDFAFSYSSDLEILG